MRVLHITRDFPPRCCGGISTMVGAMVEALAGAGVECAVVSFDAWRPRGRARRAQGNAVRGAGQGEQGGAGDKVFRLSSDEQLADAERFATAFAPEIIDVHHSMLWELGARLRDRLSTAALIKSVHVVHSAAQAQRGICEPTQSLVAQRKALAEADLAIAPSHAAARALLDDGAVTGARLTVVSPGVADSETAQAAARARAAGAPRDPSDARPVVYLGRFADVKGTGDWLEAIALLRRGAGSRSAFVVAGGLPENTKSERRWRERIAAGTPGVETTGWLDASARDRLLASAGVLVVPSRLESFGMVALEGALFGLPIVATRVGAVEEALVDRESALLCAPADPAALADAVASLLADPATATALGARAAATIRRDWTWPSRIGARVAMYERVVSG